MFIVLSTNFEIFHALYWTYFKALFHFLQCFLVGLIHLACTQTFPKTNIPSPPDTHILVFRKFLRKYQKDDILSCATVTWRNTCLKSTIKTSSINVLVSLLLICHIYYSRYLECRMRDNSKIKWNIGTVSNETFVLVSLLLTLNRFHTLLLYFHHWIQGLF